MTIKTKSNKSKKVDERQNKLNSIIFEQELSFENYVEKFTLLLDHEMDVQRASLYSCNRRYVSISEVRKNVYKLDMLVTKANICAGDVVQIKCGELKSYGEIIRINSKTIQIFIRQKPKFAINKNTKVSVFFIFSGGEFSACKKALENAKINRGEQFLFPRSNDQKSINITFDPCWVNQMLNCYQKKAVTDILSRFSSPHPYIIYGPPGTGKTTTVIEAILQIIKHYPSCRMLVVTPSNAAIDNIAERIWKYFSKTQIIRLASKRQIEKVVKDYYSLDLFETKTTQYKIILTTCGKTMSIYNNKSYKRFTHIIVDEAGQATEPETLIPLLCCNKNTHVILAGDPKQLGPYVESEKSAKCGLQMSFLERLMEREIYRLNLNEKLNDKLITLLKFNYRSIKKIVDMASGLYYDNMLLPVLKDNDPDVRVILNCLKSKFPDAGIYFKNVDGSSRINGTSSFNTSECSNLVGMYKQLLQMGLKPHHIGIITPYLAQIDEITSALQDFNAKAMPEIGTVEKYQGREKDIILISTVRTNKLGFTIEPKRINVMITRARVLTVIFGCEKALKANTDYTHIIDNSFRVKL